MAGFLREDGTACGRAEPADAWMRPAHRQARKNGWIQLQDRWSLMGGKSFGVYVPTETGFVEAQAAAGRVSAARLARQAWALELQDHLLRRAQAAASQSATSFSDMEPPDV